jgi:hypothetical protein
MHRHFIDNRLRHKDSVSQDLKQVQAMRTREHDQR